MREHHWNLLCKEIGPIKTHDKLSKFNLDELVMDWRYKTIIKEAHENALRSAKESIELWKSEAYSYANHAIVLHTEGNLKDQIIYTMGFALVMAFICFPLLTISLIQR